MKDPAVLFYTSDFITGTLTMTDAQRGKYIVLLCLQHQQGYLDEQDMLNICKSYDEKIFSKFNKDAMGYYYNKRMLLESEKRNKYSESRRKNRMNICKTYDNHMENENEDINRDKNELLIRKEAKFKNEVFEFLEKYSEVMLNKFCDYWTEKNKSKTKMRFELQKTFEISRRLVTWANNEKGFNKTEKGIESIPIYKTFTKEQMLDKLDKAGGKITFWNDYKEVKIKNLPAKVWIHVNDFAQYNINVET